MSKGYNRKFQNAKIGNQFVTLEKYELHTLN